MKKCQLLCSREFISCKDLLWCGCLEQEKKVFLCCYRLNLCWINSATEHYCNSKGNDHESNFLCFYSPGEGGGSEVAKQTAHQQWSAYQAAAWLWPSCWVLSQGNVAQQPTNPLHWLTAFSHSRPRTPPTPTPPSNTCRLFEEKQGLVPCVCVLILRSLWGEDTLPAELLCSQMLLICRGALKNPFSVWMQVSQCSPAGPDLPIGSIIWPCYTLNHFCTPALPFF